MPEFSNVTIVKKANVYFNGNVTSRTLRFADGSVKTLGFMLPGEYEFHTGDSETIEIQSGALEVLLPGSTVWKTVEAGESFSVPGAAMFTVKVNAPTDYCCSFIK